MQASTNAKKSSKLNFINNIGETTMNTTTKKQKPFFELSNFRLHNEGFWSISATLTTHRGSIEIHENVSMKKNGKWDVCQEDSALGCIYSADINEVLVGDNYLDRCTLSDSEFEFGEKFWEKIYEILGKSKAEEFGTSTRVNRNGRWIKK